MEHLDRIASERSDRRKNMTTISTNVGNVLVNRQFGAAATRPHADLAILRPSEACPTRNISCHCFGPGLNASSRAVSQVAELFGPEVGLYKRLEREHVQVNLELF